MTIHALPIINMYRNLASIFEKELMDFLRETFLFLIATETVF
jgi:hypothetical protein